MTIANLRSALPEWAKDLSLNLSSLVRSTTLTEQQQWGTFLAAAAATRNESVLVQVAEEAKEHLSEEAVSAALGAASIMAMNNVAYRARHFLGGDYANERMGLRMNIIGSSGGDRLRAVEPGGVHDQRLREVRDRARRHRAW